MKIESNSQSLILPGESPEADRRFERALRLNGNRDSAQSTLRIPAPASVQTGEQVAPQALKPAIAPRRASGRWEELYRMVTQRDGSLRKGGKVDVVA